MQHLKPEQQVTQGGCIRVFGFLLLGLGIIVGLLVVASFGKLGSGNNSSQPLTTLDDVQQYVFFQVWQLAFTFNPDDPRAKQRQMVSVEDITQVKIKFFPPPTSRKP